jgi:hypothetical protein
VVVEVQHLDAQTVLPRAVSVHTPVRYVVDPWVATVTQGSTASTKGGVNGGRLLTWLVSIPMSLAAISEWPPTSKKLSVRLSDSLGKSSCQHGRGRGRKTSQCLHGCRHTGDK